MPGRGMPRPYVRGGGRGRTRGSPLQDEGASIAERGPDGFGGLDEGVVEGDLALLVGDGFDGDVGELAVAPDDELVGLAVHEELEGAGAVVGGEDAVEGGGGAAALDVAQRYGAGL